MDYNKHSNRIKLANESIVKVKNEVEKDQYRPKYHACASAYWTNDPNGFIEYKNEYHLFYQHNPYEPKWGNIHWGHMKSKDLIQWEHLPIALAPGEEYDKDGCFSGSAVNNKGILTLFYTGNICLDKDGMTIITNNLLQTQCLATSEDGIIFKKYEGNPVIKEGPENCSKNHFRDPKVWEKDGIWYMVLGTKENEKGKIVLYSSEDLIKWDYIGVVCESDGKMGYMWECPDLITLGDKDVLIFSPQGIGCEEQPDVSGYYLGKFNYDTGKFTCEEFHLLDYGFNFYAPQTTKDNKGRRILMGWVRMDKVPNPSFKWAGAMTLPRELKLQKNRVLIQPVEEIYNFRRNHMQIKDININDGLEMFKDMSGNCYELQVEYDLHKTDSKEFGIGILCSDDFGEKTIIKYNTNNKTVCFDRENSGIGEKGIREYKIDNCSGKLTFQIFVDSSVVEIYINNGEYVMTGLVFPKKTSEKICLFSKKGQVVVNKIDFWELKI